MLRVTKNLIRRSLLDDEATVQKKNTVSGLRAAFPDIQFTTEELIAEGDKIAQRWSFTGTQKGEWMGAPPSGEKTTMRGISVVRIAKGKIAEIWSAISP